MNELMDKLIDKLFDAMENEQSVIVYISNGIFTGGTCDKVRVSPDGTELLEVEVGNFELEIPTNSKCWVEECELEARYCFQCGDTEITFSILE